MQVTSVDVLPGLAITYIMKPYVKGSLRILHPHLAVHDRWAQALPEPLALRFMA